MKCFWTIEVLINVFLLQTVITSNKTISTSTMSFKKSISKVSNWNPSAKLVQSTLPVSKSPPIMPTPTLPNGEPVPPGIETDVQIKKAPSWAEGNDKFLYNLCHLYGVYRLALKEFLDWYANGRPGNFALDDKNCDLRIYGYKADQAKKFVTITVRADNTFRQVKMFEPLSTAFIASLQDQALSVFQNLTNMNGPDSVLQFVTLPLYAVGPIKDEVYENKRSSALFATWFSVNIKSAEDAVYPNTILANIDHMIAELSQMNQ